MDARTPAGNARPAAALALLYPLDGAPHLLLTLRRANLSEHAGQVCLPGGAVEKGENMVDAALREAREEVGVERTAIDLHGALTPLHIPISGFNLHPWISTANETLKLQPQSSEVERLLPVPLAMLSEPTRWAVQNWQQGDVVMRVPVFDIDGHTLWGATAMVVAELLTLLEAPPAPWKIPD